MDKSKLLDDAVESLERMISLQTADGNFNYDPYMHGLTNGLILALATIQDVEPEFLDPPDEWLRDIKIKLAESVNVQESVGFTRYPLGPWRTGVVSKDTAPQPKAKKGWMNETNINKT